jgi:hypothetical protein
LSSIVESTSRWAFTCESIYPRSSSVGASDETTTSLLRSRRLGEAPTTPDTIASRVRFASAPR